MPRRNRILPADIQKLAAGYSATDDQPDFEPDCSEATDESPYALFMNQRPAAPSCRLVGSGDCSERDEAGPLLHLYISGRHLLITEAEHLHAVGRMWSAECIERHGARLTYRLLTEPVLGASPRHHVPAVGRVVLERASGTLRLHVEGDAISPDGRVPFAFDAA